MKTAIHPKYMDAEIRCACGNVIKTRSTRSTIIVGICNICHPFYTGQQKFVDTAGRVDKFQQRLAKTQAAQAEHADQEKEKGLAFRTLAARDAGCPGVAGGLFLPWPCDHGWRRWPSRSRQWPRASNPDEKIEPAAPHRKIPQTFCRG